LRGSCSDQCKPHPPRTLPSILFCFVHSFLPSFLLTLFSFLSREILPVTRRELFYLFLFVHPFSPSLFFLSREVLPVRRLGGGGATTTRANHTRREFSLLFILFYFYLPSLLPLFLLTLFSFLSREILPIRGSRSRPNRPGGGAPRANHTRRELSLFFSVLFTRFFLHPSHVVFFFSAAKYYQLEDLYPYLVDLVEEELQRPMQTTPAANSLLFFLFFLLTPFFLHPSHVVFFSQPRNTTN
jgi:hypothetical protein